MLSIPKSSKFQASGPCHSFLGGLEVFQKLPAEAIQGIAGKAVERKFPARSTILLEGESADRVWFVKEGHVKAMIESMNGRSQILCMVGNGSMFGSCCALGGGSYPCHVMAETDVTVVSIPMTDFMDLLGRYPQFSAALVADLSRRLRQSKDSQTFEQESVEKRILHVLIGLVHEFGNTVPLTRREIAEMAGTTVETCIRTFSRLEAAKLVSGTRGRITVKDAGLLSEFLKKD